MSYAAILVYTDGDEASDIRIRIATELAIRFDAALIGISACALRPPIVSNDLVPREIEAEIAAVAKEVAEKERKFLTADAESER